MIMSNTKTHHKRIQNQIDKLSDFIEFRKKKVDEFQSSIKKLEELNLLQIQQLKFLKDTLNLTPTILYNSGRDKKYIYGKVWWFSDGIDSKKKEYRYFLGKMDDDKPKSYWENKLLDTFFEEDWGVREGYQLIKFPSKDDY
jgi:hypothetical protein